MRRALLYSVFVSVLLLLACSGGSDPATPDGGSVSTEAGSLDSTTAQDGTSSGSNPDASDANPGATPQTIVAVYGGAAAGCIGVPATSVGDFGDPQAGKPTRPVKDGASEDGGTVNVSCRVAANGSGGFDFAATVKYDGTTFDVSGALDAAGKTTAGSMTLKKTATWTNTACKLEPTTAQMGAFAGRYWAMMTCGQSTSDANAKCDIFGQIRFENCAQN